MSSEIFLHIEKVINKTYVGQAMQARNSQNSLIKELIEKGRCPNEGWSENTIELLLREISLMDSNNFSHNVGVGEREARIYSGIQTVQSCVVVPLATGLSLVLCLLTILKQRPSAKYVIWPRIDQKSCFKSILSAGLEPVVIENVWEGDELRTDVDSIKSTITSLDPKSIVAVMTTTSCFAPRAIDKLEEVAKLCKEFQIPHLINNAYGLQASKCCHHIQQAARTGRVDAFVQSTDKNFMVPVGGAVIAGFSKDFIASLSKTYPGRASESPILDLFITFLSMGVSGYKKLLQQRKEVKNYLEKELKAVASEFNLKVLATKNNPISLAMSLPPEWQNVTHLGSMLFLRGVSGTRVLDGNDTKAIEGHTFAGWGTHSSHSPRPYLTAAASIGMSMEEVDVFIQRLRKCLSKFPHQEPSILANETSLIAPNSTPDGRLKDFYEP